MNSAATAPSAIVIGAGISGLSTAYWLEKKGFRVTVIEKESIPGGTMTTTLENGWMVERGPNSALETTPLLRQLFGEVGILDQRLYADESANRRYIVRGGKLHALPMGAGAFLKTKLWTLPGKLRLLKEPFVGRAAAEESIASFVERRLGKEFLDYAINPFVAGVYAGNPEELSVRSAFPKLYRLEEKYGGLLVGAVRSMRERKKRAEVAKDRARLFSFVDGMQTLPKALAASLQQKVLFDTVVERVVPLRAGDRPVYTVTFTRDGVRQNIDAQVVILSVPAQPAADIIRPIDPDTARILSGIVYPPVAEVFLGFRKNQAGRPLDGFGFLVPAVEKKSILGTIWSSVLFANRAPEGHFALTSFVGGSRQPESASRDEDWLVEATMKDLRELMGITGSPVYSKVITWERAIPQYRLGYSQIIGQIERLEQNYRGLYICSNYRGGIAVGDCVMSADAMVQSIVASFERH
jgi:protoporphyrinogen/coproporphyrinogen III oxidase